MIRTRAVRFHELGGPDVLRFEDVELAPLQADELLYEVSAFGLNYGELVIMKGKHAFQPPLPAVIGFESVGVVKEIGSEVTDYKPGDRIMTMVQAPPFGGVASELAVASEYSVSPCPVELSDELACAIWAQYLTAYFGLVVEAGIKMDDFVLVTAASGHAGMGAMELAKIAGATVIGTTRTHEKADLLREYGADHVIVTDEQDVSAEIIRITSGRGVRIVYDAISGSFIPRYADGLAMNAVVLLYGLLSEDPAVLPLQSLARSMANVRVYSVLSHTGKENKQALHAARDFILQLVLEGRLRPKIDSCFKFEDLVDAYKYMDAGKHIGKIVVRISKQ